MGINQVDVSYNTPVNNGNWHTVKTFTFGPAIASGVCVQWASISCCPGSARVRAEAEGIAATISTVSQSGLHYQSGVGATCISSGGCVRRAMSVIELQAMVSAFTPHNCSGAGVEAKYCITASDFAGSNACVCAGTCSGDFSYVDVTA